MRKVLLLTFLMGTITIGYAQEQTWEDIEVLLRNGSARELMKFCGNTITMKIDGKNDTYSRPNAETTLRSFFSSNPPTNFSYVHHGSSNEGLNYSIGKYTMREGSYRVVMFLKQKPTGFQLESISLTKE